MLNLGKGKMKTEQDETQNMRGGVLQYKVVPLLSPKQDKRCHEENV
jgi:hypothetical protein